ncbi:MAG: DNA gyrase inhibitor YacG [Planctomycetaceae bacterium]|nr:DNA gyrase inhibitor YacG [Planctomycetaceae bacterium]
MTTLQCPTCMKQFETDKSKTMPFCSSRCRQVDLGRWFNEEYGLPFEPTEEEPLLEGNAEF